MAQNELISLDDAANTVAEVTGWKPKKQTIKSWVKTSRIPGRQVGGRWFVELEPLKSYLSNTKEENR